MELFCFWPKYKYLPMHQSPIHIRNSGLIIVSTYLPILFQRAELMKTDAPAFGSIANQHRAVELLHYLVHAQLPSDNTGLELNKVLCGINPIDEIVLSHTVGEHWAELRLSMWDALMNHWTAIKNISLPGLLETFVIREGRLETVEEKRHLQVQRKTIDVVVDQLPWAISVVNYNWMEKPLFNTW